jgi:hypothetical protein
MSGRPVGPGGEANMSVITVDYWLIWMATRNDIVQPTMFDPPHPMLRWMKYLSPLARIGTMTMSNTSGKAMIK